jgi:hypothetical protein
MPQFLGRSPPKKGKSLQVRQPALIKNLTSLEHIISFLDFENLLKLMSLNKTFREGFTTNPS